MKAQDVINHLIYWRELHDVWWSETKSRRAAVLKRLQAFLDSAEPEQITDEEVVRRFNQLVDNVRVERRLLDGLWNDYPRSYEYRLKPPEKEEWEQAWEAWAHTTDVHEMEPDAKDVFRVAFEAGRRKE